MTLTSYWELRLKDRLMESLVMLSAMTEGGGRAAEENRTIELKKKKKKTHKDTNHLHSLNFLNVFIIKFDVNFLLCT